MTDISRVLSEATREQLNEIIREAETLLQAQLTASIAADQRAVSFASVLGAATVVVAGGAIVAFLDPELDRALGLIGMMTVGGLLLSMALAYLAAMPAAFWFPGNTPQQWVDDVEEQQPLDQSLAQQASYYAQMIYANNDIMRRNNVQMHAAMWIAWATILISAGAALTVIWA